MIFLCTVNFKINALRSKGFAVHHNHSPRVVFSERNEDRASAVLACPVDPRKATGKTARQWPAQAEHVVQTMTSEL